MGEDHHNPLASIEPPPRNLPVLAATGLLIALLAAGAVIAIRDGHWPEALTFAVAALIFIGLILLIRAARRRDAALDDRRIIKWDSSVPELQRQSINVEVRELARLMNVGDDALTDLLSAYIVAEDLALRQIQQEENLPLMRHVNIAGSAFDAILVDREIITCIEVAFLVRPDMRQEKIEAILKKISTATRNLIKMKSRLRLRLMLVLVTQMGEDEDERLRGMLITRRFTDTPVDIDIRILAFEMLQKTYVTE